MAAETGEHQVMAESNAGHCRQEDWPVTREKGGRLLMMCVEWPVAAAGGMADYCAQKGLAGGEGGDVAGCFTMQQVAAAAFMWSAEPGR
ncbi:hypothetical protein MRB53_001219 [Persea americana]|uniref:Uncharacterized protein n=1 Tax=Persea americana TaxID=3435 RepID=A0ACC2MR76_PERAE|nr:hypothetical protein MRB53_001219 [Persea americana]